MPTLTSPPRWRLCRVTRGVDPKATSSSLLDSWQDLEAHESRLGVEAGSPFLLRPDGSPDRDVVAYCNSVAFKRLATGSRESYAADLKTFLTYLETQGVDWRHATPDDLSNYEYWRRKDPDNPQRISAAKLSRELAALTHFYSWQRRRGATQTDPIERQPRRTRDGQITDGVKLQPRNVRSVRVKWLTPRAYRRWRDVGLGGYGASGVRDESWRGRNDGRNMAFADFLWASGLRLREGGTVLVAELPAVEASDRYVRGKVAEAVTKGGHGREYWVSRQALERVDAYRQTTRREAVWRANREGRYDSIPDRLEVLSSSPTGQLLVRDPAGEEIETHVSHLTAADRLRLLTRSDESWEPASLWLTESGLPMPYLTWEAVFSSANRRCESQGVQLRCHPHMLRHSFALRMLVTLFHAFDRRLGLSEEERRDYRLMFGDPWVLVQTMLGHTNVATTRAHYLEPVQGLQVDLFLNDDLDTESVDGLLAKVAAASPLVKDVDG